MNFNRLHETIVKEDLCTYIGKVKRISGMMIEATGTNYKIGEVCEINTDKDKKVDAEVVGFNDGRVLLMPYEDIKGIGLGNTVISTKHKLKIPVGDFLIGRIVDAKGQPMDGGEEFCCNEYCYVENEYINPLSRPRIDSSLSFGVKAIDGLLTIGKGQRMGIFSGSGVGKSTLLGMVAKNVKADINVIALVGERGREVREFIDKDLGEEGLKRSILVVATSDQPAMLRVKCALVATTIAEYFKDKGKDVLLMMDSLTRFAMAQREIGLATGEPPVSRGYTPSIYAELPKLLERSGKFNNGSITGIYTVLVEGDDTNEPISDTVRGIVDGHIVLTRKLANSNHYPAIDINSSISRLMNDIVSEEQNDNAKKLRDILSVYYANYDLISIGAYKKGTNLKLDEAITKIDQVNSFLKQGVNEKYTYEEVLKLMEEI
ncbi:flagellar protein export ATPase FliI [Sedimentibacter sp. MB31-C6]|uniref:flagellar protein export ATPase FliI n=1 Tax=Sedimentibacter sp. MB31-C6 TaxID=3109366 RepID=UPI002DDCAE31|nr:flagellar protein export ATPase FliI [Sedimentibacter sp. MB36-C1]WSI04993.1 flagellar protein export ATPase FliI [Sedimentibacter sp. MB36-C1]